MVGCSGCCCHPRCYAGPWDLDVRDLRDVEGVEDVGDVEDVRDVDDGGTWTSETSVQVDKPSCDLTHTGNKTKTRERTVEGFIFA